LIDSESFTYEPIFVGSKDPKIDNETLAEGRKIRGWVTFSVDMNAKDFTAVFTPRDFTGDSVDIRLH